MANQDVKVSALQSASTLSTNDLSLETVVDELSETGYTSKKITEGAKASQYLESFTFSNLTTEAKTIVGAINEAATTGGNNIFYIHWTTPSTITETGADIAAAYADGSDLVILLTDSQTGQVYTLPLVKVEDNAGALNLSFGATVYKKTQVVALLQLLKPSYTIQGMDYEKVGTAAINDTTTTSTTETWSANKINSELADKAEIADTVVSTASAWSSSQIVSLLPTESASGAVANFPDGADDVPVKSLIANIDYKDTTGFSAVNVTRTGKNLLNPSASVYYNYTINEDGTTNTSNANKRICTDFIKCDASKTLVASSDVKPSTSASVYDFVEVAFYDKDKNYISRVSQTYQNTPLVAVPPSNAAFMKYAEYGNLFIAATPAYFRDYQRQLAYEESATDYEPYQGISATIDLGGTIYGGSVDITNGTLTSTKAQDGTDLPDPVVIQISPTELSTLKGVNNIWADTGDVTVEYRADVQLYIDKKIAEAVGGNRSLSLSKSAPEEVKEEETKQEEQEEKEETKTEEEVENDAER